MYVQTDGVRDRYREGTRGSRGTASGRRDLSVTPGLQDPKRNKPEVGVGKGVSEGSGVRGRPGYLTVKGPVGL